MDNFFFFAGGPVKDQKVTHCWPGELISTFQSCPELLNIFYNFHQVSSSAADFCGPRKPSRGLKTGRHLLREIVSLFLRLPFIRHFFDPSLPREGLDSGKESGKERTIRSVRGGRGVDSRRNNRQTGPPPWTNAKRNINSPHCFADTSLPFVDFPGGPIIFSRLFQECYPLYWNRPGKPPSPAGGNCTRSNSKLTHLNSHSWKTQVNIEIYHSNKAKNYNIHAKPYSSQM